MSSSEIASLVSAFEKRQLPEKEWTHEAHISVAFYYLKKYTLHQAICLLRSNIITYNVSVGGKNTFTGGYHETLTLFWVKVVAGYIKKHETNTLDQFLASAYFSKNLPLVYYTKQRLFSTEARAVWVEPDVKPFDF